MTSGYQDYWPQDYVFPDMRKPAASQAIMQRWAAKPLDFEPGTICTYDAEVLMCAHHSALFRFTDGVCIDGPCRDAALSPLAVQVIEGRVCLC